MPHGYCYLWNPGMVWLHVISDGLITLSYYCIPVVLIYFIRKNRGIPLQPDFLDVRDFHPGLRHNPLDGNLECLARRLPAGGRGEGDYGGGLGDHGCNAHPFGAEGNFLAGTNAFAGSESQIGGRSCRGQMVGGSARTPGRSSRVIRRCHYQQDPGRRHHFVESRGQEVVRLHRIRDGWTSPCSC